MGLRSRIFVLYYVRGVYLYRKTWYNVNAAGDGTPGKYLEVFMEAYSDFARVYDIFMDNVEYEKWAEYLIGSLKEYGIERRDRAGTWLRDRSDDGTSGRVRL